MVAAEILCGACFAELHAAEGMKRHDGCTFALAHDPRIQLCLLLCAQAGIRRAGRSSGCRSSSSLSARGAKTAGVGAGGRGVRGIAVAGGADVAAHVDLRPAGGEEVV